MRKIWMCAIGVAGLAAAAAPALGQSRPLVTEDPETVPAGFVLLEAGVDFTQETHFPASGLQGGLWRVGTFGFSFGVSSIAEIQVDGGLLNRLRIENRDLEAPLAHTLDVVGDSTRDLQDLAIGAKVRVMSETVGRPAVAIRFATRLPMAGNESGLGVDTMDFMVGGAIAKTIGSIRVVGNAGLGLLADPVQGDRKNPVMTYGISVARAVAEGVEVVGELNGRLNTGEDLPPVGTDTASVMRVGARFTRGPIRFDGALLVGVTDRDPTWGFSSGLTWVFRGFTVQ